MVSAVRARKALWIRNGLSGLWVLHKMAWGMEQGRRMAKRRRSADGRRSVGERVVMSWAWWASQCGLLGCVADGRQRSWESCARCLILRSERVGAGAAVVDLVILSSLSASFLCDSIVASSLV